MMKTEIRRVLVNVGVLLSGGKFITSQPVLQFGFVYEFEDKNFCLGLFVEPKLPPPLP